MVLSKNCGVTHNLTHRFCSCCLPNQRLYLYMPLTSCSSILFPRWSRIRAASLLCEDQLGKTDAGKPCVGHEENWNPNTRGRGGWYLGIIIKISFLFFNPLRSNIYNLLRCTSSNNLGSRHRKWRWNTVEEERIYIRNFRYWFFRVLRLLFKRIESNGNELTILVFGEDWRGWKVIRLKSGDSLIGNHWNKFNFNNDSTRGFKVPLNK